MSVIQIEFVTLNVYEGSMTQVNRVIQKSTSRKPWGKMYSATGRLIPEEYYDGYLDKIFYETYASGRSL